MKTNITAPWQSALGLLVLRLFAAYEFWESGMQKWNGENWFAEINDQFQKFVSGKQTQSQ